MMKRLIRKIASDIDKTGGWTFWVFPAVAVLYGVIYGICALFGAA